MNLSARMVISGIQGFDNVDFSGVNLSSVSFMGSDLSGSTFRGTTVFSDGVQGVNLSGTNAVISEIQMYDNVDFRGVNLSGVNFMGSNLQNAQFDSTTVFSDGAAFGVNLSGTNAVISGIQGFDNVDFSGVNLSSVSFMGSDLSGSTFRGTTVFSDGVQGANLSGTNAVLTGIFSSTNFSKVNLEGVNLFNADLSGAIFTEATYDAQTVWPSGFDPLSAGAIGSGINQAPTFTSPSTFTTMENEINIFQVSANDPEGSAVTFSLTGRMPHCFQSTQRPDNSVLMRHLILRSPVLLVTTSIQYRFASDGAMNASHRIC